MNHILQILFLGDVSHPNAINWIKGLESTGECRISTWSLPAKSEKNGKVRRQLAWLKAIIGLRKEIRKLKPDLIIGYRIPSYGLLGAFSGFHPLVVAMQGASDIWPLNSWITPIKKAMARYALSKADLIQAWGEHMAANSMALGAKKERLLVLPRGIDLESFYPPENAVPLDVLKIVVTRSLFPEYGHSIILDAVAGLKKRTIPFELHIIGDGALREELKSHAERVGIENETVFHGRLGNEELPKLLRNCNLYISMPSSEGISASLFEAMACGCLPIVSDLPANRFWIEEGHNGFLITPGDTNSLEKRLMEIYKNKSFYYEARLYNLKKVRDKASLKENTRVFINVYKNLVRKEREKSVSTV